MSEFKTKTKEELIKKIEELEALIKTIREEKDTQDNLNFQWTGNLGHWYWYRETNRVLFNEKKIEALGYKRNEIPDNIGYDFFTSKIHPEDYDLVMDNMRDHLYGRSPAYEISYRIKTKSENWKWFYDRGVITKRDDAGKPEIISGVVFDITEQKEMESLLVQQNQQLLELSQTDPLTGINNRRALMEKLEYEMLRSKRANSNLCILLLDIDFFKKINDTYGHMIGDKVLKLVADSLKSSLRKTDIIGRYGGEEFLIVLPDCRLADGIQVAEKIRMGISQIEFEIKLQVTVSGGVADFQNNSIDEMIKTADDLLYKAKQKGRNRIEFNIS